MKLSFKRICAFALAIAMLVSASCMTVFAKQILTGNSGTTVYLGWTYYSDTALQNVVTELKKDQIYYVNLNFYNNPEKIEDSIQGFQLYCTPNPEDVTVTQLVKRLQALNANITNDGTVALSYAVPGGITTTVGIEEKVVQSGTIVTLIVKANRDISSTNGLLSINADGTARMTNGHTDEESKHMNVVEVPHFTASVKAEPATIYPSSTMDAIKANLTYKYINETGAEEAVDTDAVTVAPKGALAAGTSTVTVSYKGYSCDVDIEVSTDTMTGISVKTQPDLSYNSGDALNLSDLVVEATWESGNSRELTSNEYTTSPEDGTPLTVAANNGKTITVTAKEGGAPVQTAALRVSARSIATAVIGDITDAKYDNGQPVTPHPEVKLGEDVLREGTDYTLSYSNNVNATTEGSLAKITATGKEPEYTGSVSKEFEIGKATGELVLKVANELPIVYGDTINFVDGDNNALGSTTKIYYKTETIGQTEFTSETKLDAGTYTFWAVREGDLNNNPATAAEITVTINQKNITDSDVTINVPEQNYAGSPLEPDINATYGSKTLVKDKDYTLGDYKFNLKVTSESNPTSVKVTGKGNYCGETTVNFTINPKTVDISGILTSVDLSDRVYNGNAYTPAVPEQVNIDLATTLEKGKDYTVEYTNNTNAGTAKIIIKSKPGSNYIFNTIEPHFTINKAQIKFVEDNFAKQHVGNVQYTVTGGVYCFTYDGSEHGVKLIPVTGGEQEANKVAGKTLSELVDITYGTDNKTEATNAGTYPVTATVSVKPAYAQNFEIPDSVTKTFTYTWKIEKATLQVTAPDLNILCSELVKGEKKNYDYSLSWLGEGIKPIPTEAKTSNKVSFSHASESYDPTENAITFGKVEAKASTTTGASFDLTLKFDNYNDLNVTVNVNYINKKPVTVSMEKIEAVYGDSYAPVVMLGDKDVATNCTFTYNGSTEKPTNAGTYTVVATYSDNVEEDGYPGHTGTATAELVIKRRPLDVTVWHTSITYGDDKPTSGFSAKFEGELNNEIGQDDFTLGTKYEKGNGAGNYDLTCELKTTVTNYEIRTVTGKLVVDPKSLTAAMVEDVTAGLTYNGNEQKPTVTVKDGEKPLASGTDYTLTYKNNTNAGTATVTVKGTGNYTGKVEKDFSIAKATPVLELTGATTPVTYTGARYNQVQVNNPSNVNVTYHYYKDADCKQTADPINAGTYYVKISFAGDDNYNAVTPDTVKSFTIERANHPISITAASVTYTGAPYSETNITVTPTCEVTFTYYASETSTDSIARPTDVGTYWVVASYAGTDNYNSSTSARVSFSITKATPPTPAEVKVDGEDKTLKDLEDSMRKDLGNIDGEFTWRDSDGKELDKSTKIEANKEYEWIFTPTGKDAQNYLPISGKTTPYVRDDLSWLPGVLGGGSTFNFRDVTRYDYFYNAVKWAAENGIASGTSRYTFSPDAVCTRAQTVTFLWRAAGSPMPSYRISPFTDVNYGDYYYNAVLWAVEQGITTGLTATTFGPDKTVTRGQVAMFLYRAASAVKPNITNSFTDVKSTAYNYDAILWAYDNRITTGTSTTTFSPDAFCTRAQIVTFLYRFYQGR